MFKRIIFCVLALFCNGLMAAPAVQLANLYNESVPVTDYLVSEKYDGIRAIWKEGVLWSRQGNPIQVPAWFTQGWPDVWLDGELWSKRQDFEFIASTVRKQNPVDQDWRQMHYMVFDAPDHGGSFQQRVAYYQQLLTALENPYIQPVEQWRVMDNMTLSQQLATMTKAGAEGLMLHRADAVFHQGRSDDLLKLKPYMDDEAEVIGYLPGKGKYEGMLGALLVRMTDGVEFRVGTGFSDMERQSPPAIGDIITFRHHGYTKRGVPRFASFMRVRYPKESN